MYSSGSHFKLLQRRKVDASLKTGVLARCFIILSSIAQQECLVVPPCFAEQVNLHRTCQGGSHSSPGTRVNSDPSQARRCRALQDMLMLQRSEAEWVFSPGLKAFRTKENESLVIAEGISVGQQESEAVTTIWTSRVPKTTDSMDLISILGTLAVQVAQLGDVAICGLEKLCKNSLAYGSRNHLRLRLSGGLLHRSCLGTRSCIHGCFHKLGGPFYKSPSGKSPTICGPYLDPRFLETPT